MAGVGGKQRRTSRCALLPKALAASEGAGRPRVHDPLATAARPRSTGDPRSRVPAPDPRRRLPSVACRAICFRAAFLQSGAQMEDGGRVSLSLEKARRAGHPP